MLKKINYVCVAPILLSALLSTCCWADVTGLVVGVSDGDTITVLDESKTQHKIRLAGIDAPEKKQAFGQRSKEHLSDLVYRKTVTVEGNKTDRYGRTVGKVLVDGVDANLEQVKAGFAWHYKQYQREQKKADRALYSAAEDEAREAKRGLWRDPSPTPPWEFRKNRGVE
ncbi:MAG: thermonuclease family protein [Burkholderiales bacterium]|nr:thermonuclease family protein [Burkholderiales bacterium]